MVGAGLVVQAAGIRLAGTVRRPAQGGGLPLVLMIHGSGPLDRDENMRGQRFDAFNAFAHALARQGMSSFRYDKSALEGG